MNLTYVTGNWSKLLSARKVLEPLGINVKQVKLDTPEIQANTTEEIAIFSAKYACEKLKCNCLKNDTGLYLDALNGFPGPYTHYVDETLGEDGLLKLMEGINNRKAKFIEVFAYATTDGKVKTFTSITNGVIAKEKSGKFGWSWDYIFIPEGFNKTMANYSDEERYKMWNTDAYYELANYLNGEI